MVRFVYAVQSHTGSTAEFEAADRVQFMASLLKFLGRKLLVFTPETYAQFYELGVVEIRCASGRILFGRRELPPATEPEVTP